MENKKKEIINIHLSEELSDGIYSNLAIINHSPSEFVIDFIQMMPGIPKAKVKKCSVHNALVVRVKKGIHRNDGSKVKFDNNAGVLTDEKGEPIGTRIFGPVGRELREKKFMRIVSLAPEVL